MTYTRKNAQTKKTKFVTPTLTSTCQIALNFAHLLRTLVIATSSESQAIEDTNSLKASGFSSTNEQASNEALKANEMGR